jgi:uncharacterized protein (DUF1684 family)
MRYGSSLLAFSLVLLLGACGDSAPRMSDYERDLVTARLEKDVRMRDASRSILTPDTRRRFAGLNYFPVDSTYRVVGRFEPADTVRQIRAQLRKGGIDPYLRIGRVAFELDGQTHRLGVFQPADGRPVLWLPFTDGTTNRESYGGGRYLNPTIEPDGTILVDFNHAYNPDCDYNPDAYNCALPPSENRLPMRVEAGEMKSNLYDFTL